MSVITEGIRKALAPREVLLCASDLHVGDIVRVATWPYHGEMTVARITCEPSETVDRYAITWENGARYIFTPGGKFDDPTFELIWRLR